MSSHLTPIQKRRWRGLAGRRMHLSVQRRRRRFLWSVCGTNALAPLWSVAGVTVKCLTGPGVQARTHAVRESLQQSSRLDGSTSSCTTFTKGIPCTCPDTWGRRSRKRSGRQLAPNRFLKHTCTSTVCAYGVGPQTMWWRR